jgi:predicted transcriptional regulator
VKERGPPMPADSAIYLSERLTIMGHTKISVNLSDEVLTALRDLAERDNVTMTEELRRAISTFKFLQDAQREGKSVLLRDPETKETERLIFQ